MFLSVTPWFWFLNLPLSCQNLSYQIPLLLIRLESYFWFSFKYHAYLGASSKGVGSRFFLLTCLNLFFSLTGAWGRQTFRLDDFPRSMYRVLCVACPRQWSVCSRRGTWSTSLRTFPQQPCKQSSFSCSDPHGLHMKKPRLREVA